MTDLLIFIGGTLFGAFAAGMYALLFWVADKRYKERQYAYEKLGQILMDEDVQKLISEKGYLAFKGKRD